MTLKLYIDLMSQPSRALYIILKTSQCQFETKLVDLRKGEHYTEEFAKINRIQLVPVIDHDGFILTESIAIVKYLSREKLIPQSLYPTSSSQLQARVDEFLEWQHIGLRLQCALYFRKAYLDPILFNTQPDPIKVGQYQATMVKSLTTFDTKWLGRGHQFIVGDSPTVADLFAACEIEQPRMAGFDATEHFANIREWLPKVREHFSPVYEEAHVILNKIVKRSKERRANAKL